MVRGVKNLDFSNSELDFLKSFIDTFSSFNYYFVLPGVIEEKETFDQFSDNSQIYSFKDKSNREVVLTPEHTASLFPLLKQKERICYLAPCFRYERPQKDRYRQFWQLGVENIHSLNEIVILANNFLKQLENFTFEINAIGSKEERKNFINNLDEKCLCDSCKNKKIEYPFRIFECIYCSEEIFSIFFEQLSEKSKYEFEDLISFLKENNIDFKWNKRLFRGIGYYDNIVFEFIKNETVIGGGGKYTFLNTIGYGMSLGIERCLNNSNIREKEFIPIIMREEVIINKKYSEIMFELKDKIKNKTRFFMSYDMLKKYKDRKFRLIIFMEKEKIVIKYSEKNIIKYDDYCYEQIKEVTDSINNNITW